MAFIEHFHSATQADAAGWSRWRLPGNILSAGSYETDTVDAGRHFDAISVSWPVTSPNDPGLDPSVEIAVSNEGESWSEWLQLQRDPHVARSLGSIVHTPPILHPGRFFRLRIDLQSGIQPNDLQITIVDTVGTGASSLQGEIPAPDLISGFIISRAGWGADESWRYVNHDPQLQVAWVPRYMPIEKIVIHHTVTAFGYDDPSAVVRAIYHYHAVVLDWGDIGYNYLIDWAGNVYEGRFGGPGVVGGHALQYNPGSVGIAFIGDYSYESPSAAALDALEQLYRARASFVDVTLNSDWVDLGDVPHLSGHGDLMNTACPGYELHEALPAIRGRLAGTGPVYLPKPIKLEDAKILELNVSPIIANPGELLEIQATVTNAGKLDLISQGPDPGYVYNEGESYQDAGFPKLDGFHRLAADVNGDNAISNPYRWGLGGPLSRDEIRTVAGYIRPDGYGTRRISVSIIKEFVRYYDDAPEQFIHVLHPLTVAVNGSSDTSMMYFDVTGHNVPDLFYQYWAENGGLMRFGYPLTEPFWETSLTDGVEYLTQYFERGRLEHHPEYQNTQSEVLLGHLGAEQTAHRSDESPFLPVAPIEEDADIWYFPESGHTLSYRFLGYWLEHGGVSAFGYPISEKFEEESSTDGSTYLVQYFERNRFEYHPEVAIYDDQILLGHLGREILIARGWLPGPEVTSS